jgi:6-phosphogluconolactonase
MTPTPPPPTTFLISTYTDNDILAHSPRGAKGLGVYTFVLDETTGELKQQNTLAVGPNVAYLIKHPTKDIVYATTECIDKNGELLTLGLSPEGTLTLLDRHDARGRSTCAIHVHPTARFLTVVNYWDATLVTFSLDAEGRVTGSRDFHAMPGAEYVDEKQPDKVEHWMYRQRWPHTHCAVTAPRTDRVFVCDLGRDKVLHYTASRDGHLRPRGEVQLDRQIGPRGIEFHPTLPVAYITNELTSTVSVCRLNVARAQSVLDDGATTAEGVHDEGALLFELQRLSTLPEEWRGRTQTTPCGVWKAASHSSEIHVHPSGRFLFIGNRGHDSIACFLIDPVAGTLTLSGICPSRGECPRNFNVSPSGRWMVVGNQDTNTVAVFAIDPTTGMLEPRHEVPCPSVNFVYPLPPSPPPLLKA